MDISHPNISHKIPINGKNPHIKKTQSIYVFSNTIPMLYTDRQTDRQTEN